MITKKGINASPGVAIGPVLVLDSEEYRIPRKQVEPKEVPEQISILENALLAAREEVGELRLAAARKLGNQTAAIFAFHESFIGDAKLLAEVTDLVRRTPCTSAFAFAQVMKQRQRLFRDLTDPYMKERVRDLADIEKKVLRYILGRSREDITTLSNPVIVVAHEITPSQAISLDRDNILGFAIDVGGQTSHTAIIARMQGIPAVVALGGVAADVSGGETVIVDGTHGIVVINPDDDTTEHFRAKQVQASKVAESLVEIRELPAVTQDEVKIDLLANIELAEEARYAVDCSAEGIGLYRTEFLFLASERLPTEDEQTEVFRAAIRHAQGRPVVIRTIDLGAEKIAAHMAVRHEDNPDLGLRSLRYCLQNLDMFKAHLRAILRASMEGEILIMFPMITTLLELRQAKATLADVMEDLDEDGVPFRKGIKVGMMIETPAAALLAGAFAREADFLSIGTNDLTQYTLAVDRGNERVAHLYAPHNPAVIRLMQEIIRAGAKEKTPIGMCGEMAGSPVYCQLLLGLGLRQLSMAPSDIPVIKRLIRRTTIRRCTGIARKALRFDADRQVVNYLRDELRKIDPEAI